MEMDKIQQKKKQFEKILENPPPGFQEKLDEYKRDFEVEFAYNSLALSGSTLTYEEVKRILDHFRRLESMKKKEQ